MFLCAQSVADRMIYKIDLSVLHLSYPDVSGSRRDHDKVVVAHRHVLVLDHIRRGLTSRTIPSANTAFVLLICSDPVFISIMTCVSVAHLLSWHADTSFHHRLSITDIIPCV